MTDEESLLAAVQKNDATGVRTILDRNPLILRTRTPNGTLVLTAAFYGATDALKILLERTPEDALNLYEAATVGNARRLKTILGQSRTRVDDATKEEGFSPLGLAAFFGHVEAMKVLLANGADVNAKPPSRFQNTAVDSAVSGDHADIVRMLLDAGADPNATREGGNTPLDDAREKGHQAIAELLKERGAKG